MVKILLNIGGCLECDPRAEVFAYHTDGRVKDDGEDDVDDRSSKIIVAGEFWN